MLMKYSFKMYSSKITVNLFNEIKFNKMSISLINFYEKKDFNYNMLICVNGCNDNIFINDDGMIIKYTSQIILSGKSSNQILYKNDTAWDYETKNQKTIISLDIDIYINGYYDDQINDNNGMIIELNFD